MPVLLAVNPSSCLIVCYCVADYMSDFVSECLSLCLSVCLSLIVFSLYKNSQSSYPFVSDFILEI